ncbi:1518_t:CDS:2, partial [Funneliformis geosporum]
LLAIQLVSSIKASKDMDSESVVVKLLVISEIHSSEMTSP